MPADTVATAALAFEAIAAAGDRNGPAVMELILDAVRRDAVVDLAIALAVAGDAIAAWATSDGPVSKQVLIDHVRAHLLLIDSGLAAEPSSLS